MQGGFSGAVSDPPTGKLRVAPTPGFEGAARGVCTPPGQRPAASLTQMGPCHLGSGDGWALVQMKREGR